MAFNENLSDRIRTELKTRTAFTEKKMFGGICFMVNGNMCCGVVKDEMIVRLDRNETDDVLADPHARLFDFSGKKMHGWFYIHADGLGSRKRVAEWTQRAVQFVRTLPPK